MKSSPQTKNGDVPGFCEGIAWYGEPWPDFDKFADVPVIAAGQSAIANHGDIKVHSKPGKTEFSICIPIRQQFVKA